MTRTFIAIDLGDAAREALRGELRRLSRVVPNVRLTDPTDLHLTLVFLGELDDERLAAVIAVTREVAQHTAPFSLALAGLGVFGPPSAPRIIWAGVAGDLPRLQQTQRRLAAALAERGFPQETRPYAPHLTLARLKRPLDATAAQELGALLTHPPAHAPRWRVTDTRVMRSDLSANGTRYTPISIAPFASAG